MSAILPFVKIDSESLLAKYFTPYQVAWIEAEDPFHQAKQQVFALAEKSVRIGWTFCDGFKNVRKRLRFKKRDYLFVTKDYPSPCEYMNQVYDFADMLGYTRGLLSHGEDILKVKSLDAEGHPTSVTEEIKIGYMKFDNGSRIIAFSSNPYAMAVYGGDVGIDEFAKHPNASLLWETAQSRVTWGGDLAVWSSHDGEDTLFNEFAQEARAACSSCSSFSSSSSVPEALQHRASDASLSTLGRGTEGEVASSAPNPNPVSVQHPLLLGRGEGRVEESRPSPSSDSALSTLHSSLKTGEVLCSSSPPSHALRPYSLSAGGEGRGEVAPSFPSTLHSKLGTSSSAPLDVDHPLLLGRGEGRGEESPASGAPIENQNPKIQNPTSPWNLYFRVTMADAIELGVVELINRVRGSSTTREEFLADCRTRSRQEEIFQQAYMCNPLGAAANHIVDWSAIERCRADYPILRVHLEHSQIIDQFGEFNTSGSSSRQNQIERFLHKTFEKLFTTKSSYRLGFDVAASGQGDLAVIYIDEAKGDVLTLKGLFTCRTEDWHFLSTVLSCFLRSLKSVQAAGDETGLGKQICWEARERHRGLFSCVNFSSKKHDLGFALMNQLATAKKRFPRSEQDIAADYFALRRIFTGNKWAFSEGRNSLNPFSHCDIAWAGALASHAHSERKNTVGCAVLLENGMMRCSDGTVLPLRPPREYPNTEHDLLWSDDPRIWKPLR